MNFRKRQQEIVNEFMDSLNRHEKAEFVMMSKQWLMLRGKVDRLIDDLLSKGKLSENQLFMLGTYRDFQTQLVILNARYAQYSTNLISAGQDMFGTTGLQGAQSLLDLSGKFYTKIPVAFVERMVGNTSAGTPLYDLLSLRYGENASRATNILIESMALGRNPLESARLIGATIDGSLSDTIRIARTEQMNVLREAQTASYIASGLVETVDVVAEPDACELCLEAEAENPHELGYVLDIHPNCRCSLAPNVG